MQSKFKDEPVLITLILSAITLGIYPVFWYRRKNSVLRNNKIPTLTDWAITMMLVLILVSWVLHFVGAYAAESKSYEFLYFLKNLSALVLISLFLTHVSLAFSFKDRLENYLRRTKKPANLSEAATLFLGIVYLQYKINFSKAAAK